MIANLKYMILVLIFFNIKTNIITGQTGSTLITEFKMVKSNNVDLTICWTTKNEVEIENFELEKSFDRINFEKFAKVEASGFQNTYCVFDKYDNIHNIIYYRLSLINKNFSKDIFGIKAFQFIVKNKLEVWPNPNNGLFFINTENYILYDIFGKIIDNKNILSKGIYFIYSKTEILKIIVE